MSVMFFLGRYLSSVTLIDGMDLLVVDLDILYKGKWSPGLRFTGVMCIFIVK